MPAAALARRADMNESVASPTPPQSGLQGWWRPDDLTNPNGTFMPTPIPNKVNPGTFDLIAASGGTSTLQYSVLNGRKAISIPTTLPSGHYDSTIPHGTPPFSEWMVLRLSRASSTDEAVLWGGAGVAGTPALMLETNDGLRLQRQDVADLGFSSAGVASNNNPHRILITWDASNNYVVYCDAVSVMTGTSAAPAAGGLRVGAHCTNVALIHGDYELLESGRYNKVLSSTERSDLDTYIRAFFGL